MREYNRTHPPKKAIGVYIISISGQVVYVGRTDKLNVRLNTHRKDKSPWVMMPFDLEWVPCVSYGESLVLEAMLIRDHQPIFNKDGVTR